jgi:IS5 family transposase
VLLPVVSTNSTLDTAVFQAPPVVDQLHRVFEALDDEPLIQALIGPTRRGPKGHSVIVLWHCVVARYVLGLESTEALRRELRNNPFVAQACGIESPDAIPHHSTFSRFFARLSKYQMAAKVKDVSRRLVRRCYAEIPGFGERVALDSTTLKGWSNGGKPRKADSEAGWSVKKGTQGLREFTYGWKLHLIADCETELPISANISPGNIHDVTRASNALQEARHTTSKFRPRFFMADAGYSSKDLVALVKRQYRAEPIIQTNRTHKKAMLTRGAWENTLTWKTLYAQRQAVERVFSRLKGQRSLNHIRVRGIRKVTVHCYLSLIALQALYLS